MPSPENDTVEDNTPDEELPDDALIGPRAPEGPIPANDSESLPSEGRDRPGTNVNGPGIGTPAFPGKRRRVWLWALLGLLVGIPLVLTLIGALTSPPHLKGIPSGHLVYLEAEAPSEHTTTLRGLYVAGPDGATHLLVHETEPQDTDGGIREWITQPAVSPDGTKIAFEKQFISLQEEKQSVQNQVWVMPLMSAAPTGDAATDESANKPHLVMDLTDQKLKQIVGLAWDSDSSLFFLEDDAAYSVPTDTTEEPLKTPLDLNGLTPTVAPDVSATRNPSLTESGGFAYSVQTAAGPQVLIRGQNGVTRGPASAVFALSPDGSRIAFVPPGTKNLIRIYDTATNQYDPDLKVRWGWSVFGKREITSLRWSPDGSQIAFTVSKPPIPDDEIFLITVATGQISQLPYRTGRAAWDWTK